MFQLKKFIYKIKRKVIKILNKRKRLHKPNKEVLKNYGKEFPEKTFYVIGVDEGWCGLFAIIVHQLTHIAYAVERGLIPVVDLQNYTSQYVDFEDRFKINAWELFFEQPGGFKLIDIKRAKNVILSISYCDPPDKKYLMPYEITTFDTQALKYWSKLFKSYIRINQEIINNLEKEHIKLFQNRDRVLGVKLRGTDYLTLKPIGHPIQPSVEESIQKVKHCLKEWHCNYIYLATEDANIFSAYLQEFGEILIKDDYKRWTEADLYGGKSNSNLFITSAEKQAEGIEYLSQMYFLSKCTSFVSGNTRGSLGVMLMTKGFENEYIFDLGLYQ